MIDRQHGEIVFECDVCGATLETGERDWSDAKALFDRERWRAKAADREWTHACPDCKSKI